MTLRYRCRYALSLPRADTQSEIFWECGVGNGSRSLFGLRFSDGFGSSKGSELSSGSGIGKALGIEIGLKLADESERSRGLNILNEQAVQTILLMFKPKDVIPFRILKYSCIESLVTLKRIA